MVVLEEKASLYARPAFGTRLAGRLLSLRITTFFWIVGAIIFVVSAASNLAKRSHPPLRPYVPTQDFEEPDSQSLHAKPLNVNEYKDLSACRYLNKDLIHRLQYVSKPEIEAILDERSSPASLCVLIALPQNPIAEDGYTDIPIAGFGPDSIHMLITAADASTIQTFSAPLPLPGQPGLDMVLAENAIIYYLDTTIPIAGAYNITGERERANWKWRQSWLKGEIGPGEEKVSWTGPSGMRSKSKLREVYDWNPEKLPTTSFEVQQSSTQILEERPFCDRDNTAGKGRWFGNSSAISMNADLYDEFGYAWDGDQCRLDYFDTHDIGSCLQNKVVHFWGDSNLRRAMKMIMSGGRWCRDENDMCNTRDKETHGMHIVEYDEKANTYTDKELPSGRYFDDQSYESGKPFSTPISWGKNSTFYLFWSPWMAHMTDRWTERLWDKDDLESIELPKYAHAQYKLNRPKKGAIAHVPSGSLKADLVVLDQGQWDSALTESSAAFEIRLRQFRDALLQAYGRETRFIVRLQHSFCCRGFWEHDASRLSGARILEFDQVFRRVFRIEGNRGLGGQLLVHDPMSMNGRTEPITKFKADVANHVRGPQMRMEMQMLLSSVCRRDTDGLVQFED